MSEVPGPISQDKKTKILVFLTRRFSEYRKVKRINIQVRGRYSALTWILILLTLRYSENRRVKNTKIFVSLSWRIGPAATKRYLWTIS